MFDLGRRHSRQASFDAQDILGCHRRPIPTASLAATTVAAALTSAIAATIAAASAATSAATLTAVAAASTTEPLTSAAVRLGVRLLRSARRSHSDLVR